MITKTISNVIVANALANRMEKSTAQNRITLATTGLALLKQEEPVNGEVQKVQMAAIRLANALKKEYKNPQTAMKAATVATELRSFAMGMAPMVDTLCLA